MSEIQSFPGQVNSINLNEFKILFSLKQFNILFCMYIKKKTIKCRAAVCYGPNTPLVVENIDVAPPKAGEVRIKVIASGICHTDLHFTDNHLSAVYPIILGHEGSGIVESVGEGVTSVAVGDHVIPVLLSQCKECDWCVNRADSNLCQRFSFKIGDQPGEFLFLFIT
jgi:D-arabinose 1-dehydrogenase-like Zn-dependent alcohol dehydrogenase